MTGETPDEKNDDIDGPSGHEDDSDRTAAEPAPADQDGERGGPSSRLMGLGIAVGAAIGAALFAATGEAYWIAGAVGVGVAVGAGLGARRR